MTRAARLLALALVLAACEQELTVPGGCPDLCPGGQPQVRDTVLTATPDQDSTFVGYQGWSSIPFLLVSDGLPAGETRAWFRFEPRPDTVLTAGTYHPYTADSVALVLQLTARDSTVSGLTLYYHLLPADVDTLKSFDWVDSQLTDETLVDSLVVPDSVLRGSLRKVLTGEALERFVPEEEGLGIALGVRMRADEPTGIRLTAFAAGGVAIYTTYAFVDVPDTTARRPQLNTIVADNGFVRNNLAGPEDPTVHYLGRLPAARTVLRFEFPEALRDPRLQLVRATLELEPEGPLDGLRNDPAILQVRGTLRDIGAKSTPTFLVQGSATLPVGSSDPVRVNVLSILQLWQSDRTIPTTMLLALAPEGATFHQPVFRSTRSPSGAPRLRVTYVRPSAVEQP